LAPATPSIRTKERFVTRSLSVILPVHNAQSWLAQRTIDILEIVAELTDRFELMICDLDSTDGTWDVVRELARRYPQVRPVRQPAASSASRAIPAALREARGDVIVGHDGITPVDGRDLVRLWRSVEEPAAIRQAPRPPTFRRRSPLRRILGIAGASQTALADAPAHSGGFRILRPVATIGGAKSTALAAPATAVDSFIGREPRKSSATRTEGDAAQKPKRPNFLGRAARRVGDGATSE
jgi:hypothetical protein